MTLVDLYQVSSIATLFDLTAAKRSYLSLVFAFWSLVISVSEDNVNLTSTL
jgi:hypothetical protein